MVVVYTRSRMLCRAMQSNYAFDLTMPSTWFRHLRFLAGDGFGLSRLYSTRPRPGEKSVGKAEFRHRPLLRRFLDLVFGYDYFISYSWRDGATYASALARRLEALGYQVFLDRFGYASGDDWKSVGAWTLRRTGQLILIVTSAALTSGPVEREVRIFRQTGRRIIPVSIDGALDRRQSETRLLHYLPSEILKIDEPAEALFSGPSVETVSTIQRSFTIVRQDKKRVRAFGAIALLLAVLAAASTGFAFLAKRSATEAQRNQRHFTTVIDLLASDESSSFSMEDKSSVEDKKTLAVETIKAAKNIAQRDPSTFKILWIDDHHSENNQGVVEKVKNRLRGIGVEIDAPLPDPATPNPSAITVLQALAIVKDKQFDLIISNYGRDRCDRDGQRTAIAICVLDRVKTLSPQPPVIIYSAGTTPETADMMRCRGAVTQTDDWELLLGWIILALDQGFIKSRSHSPGLAERCKELNTPIPSSASPSSPTPPTTPEAYTRYFWSANS